MSKKQILNGKIIEVKNTHIRIQYGERNFKINGYFPKASTQMPIALIKQRKNGIDYTIPTLEAFEEIQGTIPIKTGFVEKVNKRFATIKLHSGEVVRFYNLKGLKVGKAINALAVNINNIFNHIYMIEA